MDWIAQSNCILISCGARLAVFDIQELRELTAYDELELDTLGDRKTALFLLSLIHILYAAAMTAFSRQSEGGPMQTINLKQYYPFCTEDTFGSPQTAGTGQQAPGPHSSAHGVQP